MVLMCGILGFSWEDKHLIKKMGSEINHRGPDQEGYFFDKNVSLCNKRLAIIDLSEKGRQPIYNEDNSIVIVYNGEIFNFLELKPILEKKGHKFKSDTDTEVIVHGYEEYGPSFVNKLNGFFAFCIFDSKKKQLFIARDRLGIKPLYYYYDQNNGELVFASEIKAILASGKIKPSVNTDALNKFVAFGYNYGNETIFNDIKKLPPGHMMFFDMKNKSLKLEQYWKINYSDKNIENKPEKYFIENLSLLLHDSVEKRLISDVPLGVFLSGGIDSSTIVGLMDKINKEKVLGSTIKTYSVGFPEGTKGELDAAKLVSEHYGTDHKEFVMDVDIAKLLPSIAWHSDEPIGDPALLPIYLLSKHAKKTSTVILTGDGADELFAGYEQYKFLTLSNKMRFVPKMLRFHGSKLMLNSMPTKIQKIFFKYADGIGKAGKNRAIEMFANIDNKAKAYTEFVSLFDDSEREQLLASKIKRNLKIDLATELNGNYFNNKNNFLNQLLALETETLLVEDFLMKNDKMTMAASIEARTPYLDYRVAELAFKIPPKLKLKGMTEKYILRKAMQKILPKEIYSRKKQRFYVPIDNWLKTDLKPTIDDLLSKKAVEKQGYFNYAYIDKLLKNYGRSPLFYSRQLWNLLTFQTWHKIYIEGYDHKKLM